MEQDAEKRMETGKASDGYTAHMTETAHTTSPVPNIEDGGCDICDDPLCYRNLNPSDWPEEEAV